MTQQTGDSRLLDALPEDFEINYENVSRWLAQVMLSDKLAPTCYHALLGSDTQATIYAARNNPPDVRKLALAYLNAVNPNGKWKDMKHDTTNR